MSCRQLERLIALYAGGDLGERDARRVEVHLRECASCRELHAELVANEAGLRELREEAVNPAVLAAVRQRVIREVATRRPSLLFAWRWKHGLAVAAVVLVVGITTLLRRPLETPAPELAAPVLHVPEAPAVVATRPARMPARQARKPAPQKQREMEPLVVKLVTDDPDVVIYWLIDRTGD